MKRFFCFLIIILNLVNVTIYGATISELKNNIKTKVLSRVLSDYDFVKKEDVEVSFSFTRQFEELVNKSASIEFDLDSVDRFLGRTSLMVSFFDKANKKISKNYLFLSVKAKANYIKAKTRIRKRDVLTRDMLTIEKVSVYGKPYNSFHDLKSIIGKESLFDINKGSYLTKRYFQDVPLLRRGTRVSLIMKKNNVEVVVPGEILSDGSVGDWVMAKTLFKKSRRVKGKILNGEYIEISTIN